METTRYFEMKVRVKRPYLQDAWLKEAWEHPIHREIQENGRVRHFIYIAELDKFLRVVFEGKMVHNAFLDRGFKPHRQ
jgi:hypothetical protein